MTTSFLPYEYIWPRAASLGRGALQLHVGRFCAWLLPGSAENPGTIRLDSGPEFISRELDLWAYLNGVTLDFSRPGKPTDNAFIESFNGSIKAECLNASWFMMSWLHFGDSG